MRVLLSGYAVTEGASVTAGHPQKASGEGSDRAAISDRGPLHSEEEGRGGAHRSR